MLEFWLRSEFDGIYVNLSIKLRSNPRILFGIFSEVKILKTPFSSGPVIFFYRNAGYWNGWASVFLFVNMLSLSNTILACSKCFLGCPWPSLIDSKSVKDTNRGACIEAASIKSTCIKDIYARGTGIKDIYIIDSCSENAYVKDICAEGTSTVKYSRIHSLFFGILKMKLFGMG